MKRLILLVLLTLSVFAQPKVPKAPEHIYPSDYTPSPCAPDTDKTCLSFTRASFAKHAALIRGYNIPEEWLDAHWSELLEQVRPTCAKLASCYTLPDNDWQFCLDSMRTEFVSSCDRYPEGSVDRDGCTMFAMIYWVGIPANPAGVEAAHECTAALPPAPEGTLEVVKIDPPQWPMDYNGRVIVYAIDAERRLPLRAKLAIETGKLRSIEGPIPTAGYPLRYTAKLKRIPSASGKHEDIVVPKITLTANGYKTLVFDAPIELPKMTFEMSPAAEHLRRGPNVITITARDTATGQPVSARVMGDDRVLGETNKPFVLEVAKGRRRPEIWLTSLYDQYSDVVVVPGR
jgi:hypothetical protein